MNVNEGIPASRVGVISSGRGGGDSAGLPQIAGGLGWGLQEGPSGSSSPCLCSDWTGLTLCSLKGVQPAGSLLAGAPHKDMPVCL